MCNIARSYVTWIISYVTWRIHTWLNTCLCHMTTSHVTWLIHYDTLRFHVCTRRFQYLCWVFLCTRLVAPFGTFCTCFSQYIEKCSMCIERYSINIGKNSIHMRVVLQILLVNRKMLNIYWNKLDIYAYGIDVYVSVYIYVFIHIYTYTNIHIYIYIYVYMCMYACICIYTYIPIYSSSRTTAAVRLGRFSRYSMCCSVLQCGDAARCSMLQCVAVCRSVFQRRRSQVFNAFSMFTHKSVRVLSLAACSRAHTQECV